MRFPIFLSIFSHHFQALVILLSDEIEELKEGISCQKRNSHQES